MPIGAILGGAQIATELGMGLFQLIKGVSSHPKAPQAPKYQKSQAISDMAAFNQSLLNGRSTAAKIGERNIRANQANTAAQIQDTATNPAQALALISANSGQTNNAINNLAVQEDQDFQNRLRNYMNSQRLLAGEEQKEFQYNQLLPYEAKMKDYERAQAEKSRLLGAGISNLHSGMGNAAGLAQFYQKPA
ncbi:MAG: hypothetical protein CMI36_01045 [Owenweeksia sp.]|nr:hypothetical protein [Owenweeksia sp.]MBF97549.1 hypothetical protein [Owenweeksia sp.]HBF18750.1 hypothetical protein [Cryomorphaceae bacterium]HCQ17351.1 hypothetical protein [Cryomorphaceae bacterium]|tara:strand:- start:47 stop:619 length:573 start_codon:yes stop_codon:yes gene_type:complete